MAASRIATRYAKSLLNLAFEQGKLEAVYEDMQLVESACQGSRDLEIMLKSPVVKADKKEAVLQAVFGGKLGEMSMKFLQLLTRKKRERYVADIATSFIAQYKKHKHILSAVITTAVKLDDKVRKEVVALVQSSGSKEVAIEEVVDKEIIGGFILRVEDKQIDASLKSKLQKLTRSFNENPYISEL